MIEATALLKMLVALLVMVDPPGAIPLFLSLTDRHADARTKIAIGASLTLMLVLLISGFFGNQILGFFGISLDSFRIMGGLLLMFLALDMLNARPSRTKRTPDEETEAVSRRELAVIPIGMPLLAGPGAMSSVLIYMGQASQPIGKLQVAGVVVATSLITMGTLLAASWIGRKLGQTGINIIKRIFGLILGAIAVEMIVRGVGAMLPGLVAA